MVPSGGSTLTAVGHSSGSVTPYAERARENFTFGKTALDLFDPSFAELGQPTLKFSVATVVNEDRCRPRQHIVRVLRDPSLSAYSQISGGFGLRWCPWLCGGIRGCCRRYCRQMVWTARSNGC